MSNAYSIFVPPPAPIVLQIKEEIVDMKAESWSYLGMRIGLERTLALTHEQGDEKSERRRQAALAEYRALLLVVREKAGDELLALDAPAPAGEGDARPAAAPTEGKVADHTHAGPGW